MDAVFIECFGDLKEPRVERTKKYLLLDILALSICGVLSGAEGWEEIEDFAKEHESWFKKFLILPHRIPSHDTISRVFSALELNALQSCCIKWVKRISRIIAEDVIAVDGKALRGSKRVNECKKAFHITWDHAFYRVQDTSDIPAFLSWNHHSELYTKNAQSYLMMWGTPGSVVGAAIECLLYPTKNLMSWK